MSGLAEKKWPGMSIAGGVGARPSENREQAPAPGRKTSEDLLGGRAELIIMHAGREYRLRVTQNGKLILTA